MSPCLSQKTLDALLCALCADFDRRRLAIGEGRLSRRVLFEYRYLNDRILGAAISVCADYESALTYVREIGARTGYANSALEEVSEITYKRRKNEIRRRILEQLSLIDRDTTELSWKEERERGKKKF